MKSRMAIVVARTSIIKLLAVHQKLNAKPKLSVPLQCLLNEGVLTLFVLTFLVHSGIGVGHNVPSDIETPVKPQVFVQIK